MGLHDGIRYESSRDLISTEPTTMQTLYSLLGRFDGIEFHVYLTLTHVSRLNLRMLNDIPGILFQP